MAAIANNLITNILTATLPTGTSGAPGSFTALAAGAMKVRLNSTASTGAAAGTEIGSGGGYTTGGTALANAITLSGTPSTGALPATTALSWTNSSAGTWSVMSFDLTDSAGTRTWYGNFNGTTNGTVAISVAVGNTFQIAVGGITVSLT
jgi:hypothetical protein